VDELVRMIGTDTPEARQVAAAMIRAEAGA
jgi:hypothetical protein